MFSTPPQRAAPSFSDMLVRKAPPTDADLSRVSIDELMECLHTLRGRNKSRTRDMAFDRHARISLLVRHLIVKRRHRLTPFLYECAMAAAGDPQSSGVTTINLMRDMSQQRIEPTQEFYNLALECLMIHPNYVAMLEILELMHGKWAAPQLTHAVVLLRDEQYELAYEKLMELQADKVRVDPWVYDVFVLVFGKMGFLDEMLELLAARRELRSPKGMDVLELYALDACSAAFHYPGTVMGWKLLVRSGKLNPTDGMVENVLDTAARATDTALATEALDLLAQRTKVRDYHYDSLIDALTQAGDIATVVRVYCIMHDSGIPVTKDVADRLIESTRDIGPELNSWLFEDAEEGRLIPRTLVDAAMAKHIAASDYPLAMDLFAHYDKLCGGACPADVTLQLIRQCKDLATTSELCARFLDGVRVAGVGAAGELLEQFHATIGELFADGMATQGQACYDKLVERGFDVSAVQRPAWWTAMNK